MIAITARYQDLKTLFHPIAGAIAAGLLVFAGSGFAQTGQNNDTTSRLENPVLPYTVIDNKVDHSTFLGWRVFQSTCYICHGVDATGTAIAPDLTERVKTMTAQDFIIAVLYRYPIIVGFEAGSGDDLKALREAFLEELRKHDGGELRMPAWDNDPNIKPHVLDLYAYLRARADGALGPGRPAQLNEK
jgi:hypothetical protein